MIVRFKNIKDHSVGPQCGDPGDVPHASRDNTSQGPFERNTRITYTCEAGYQGGGYIYCGDGGEWSSLPTCTSHGKQMCPRESD